MATLLHQDQQLGQLSEVIHRLLSEKECYIFDRGLADYHRRRNVKSFVECLSIVLNTSNKRKLLIPIRDAYVKPSDLSKFNQLVPANGLATNRKKVKAEVKGNTDGVRKLEVKRDADGQWGFSIRGGSEHGIGIFVSWVEPGTNAEKSGLLVGDQILKANDANFDRISHYDAAMLVKNAKKLRLFVLAHGRVPGSRMAHKVYCWIDSEGRPASPPPDPFEIQDDSRNGEFKLINDADERKVTVMIDRGNELGISIRGGIEHGLGIYVSAVEEDSVAESYGLKIGDQILEVNGISFLGIVHADAANALRAQSCMVMKVKDVGKLPHSRMTTHSQTKWYPSPQGNTSSEDMKDAPVPFFRAGIGSQVMLGQQQDTLLHSGLLRDVAQSVLTEQELAMFMYLLNQYQQHGLTVNGLVTPLLNLLDTPEKLQLLTELRGLMKPHDMERFNELTVHKQIMAKKYGTKQRNDDGTNSSEDGGRDKIPQKLSPQLPGNHFHIPPPPTSIPPSTPSIQPVEVEETDDGDGDGDDDDDSWDKNWGSYDVTPIKSTHKAEKIDTSLIEERVRAETEYRLRSEFSDKEKRILEEQQQLLEKERAEREKSLSRKRDSMEREMKLREEAIKLEMAEKIRNEIENKMNAQLEEKEKALQLENERRLAEHKEREEQFQLTYETTKQKLEEDIWKEADERIREEYEIKRRQEREASLLRRSKVSQKAEAWDVEGRIRKELENKIRKECEEKVRLEMQKLKRQEDKERMEREEELEQQKREQKIAQLEAEEQSRIEIEEKIRRETEAKVRFEYEARLQHETEERARLAEEVKVRKAAEERLQIDRIELEKQKEKELEEIKKEQQRERVKREREEREREKREREEREREVREREKREREKREREEREKKKKGSPKEKREEPERSRKINENLQSDQSVSPTPAELEEERFLEKQRLARDNQEREEERLRQQEVMADLNEKNKKEAEINKKKELERKREENLRKREEQRKQKEIENKRKQEENTDQTDGSTRQPLDIEKKMKKKQELEHIAAIEVNSQKVKVNFGEDETGSMKKRRIKKVKEEKVEEDRRKAEDKLEKRLKQSQGKKQGEAKSYGGFTDIKGTILHITVTKIVKKLGIAIDGGANTKQKAVIIREIAPEGCAAQTGMGMAVNQQILEVNGVSLFGLKHREVVMAIKNGFDGPLNKEIVFVVVDSQGT